ncbi:hypothetical protein D9613_007361 [Agrocybe pediades]|uniref:Uncharacterized protein n=1 Tax=Agrocybe pediades TaxID=84607 RepID=A0A8H4VNC8_9AGAR|nr:hypothetical protein D9613_007361 [Agrocybe pediades]
MQGQVTGPELFEMFSVVWHKPHRYIFLLYKQSSGYTAAVETLVNPNAVLAFFNASRFASAAGLGQPIGGNFILIKPDASSPLTTTPPKPTPP